MTFKEDDAVYFIHPFLGNPSIGTIRQINIKAIFKYQVRYAMTNYGSSIGTIWLKNSEICPLKTYILKEKLGLLKKEEYIPLETIEEIIKKTKNG